jgi:hypothetical protein
VALQPPLLPQVEARKAGGEREAGERGQDQADVEEEEGVAELASALVTRTALSQAIAKRHRCKRHDDQAE